MDVTVLLCDWAEVVAGKLYAQGIGWTRVTSGEPTSFAVGVLVYVPYDKTNEKHVIRVRLTTEDGDPFPADGPAEFAFDFELGRPPGLKRGQEQVLALAGKVNGAVFQPGGYRWQAYLDDEPVSGASFLAVPRQGATP